MLNEIKEKIKEIIDDIDTLKNDIDYYKDAETIEDLDFRDWYKRFNSIITNLEDIIKED